MASIENALTIFELCFYSVHENGAELCQKCNGNVLMKLCLQIYVIGGKKWGPIKLDFFWQMRPHAGAWGGWGLGKLRPYRIVFGQIITARWLNVVKGLNKLCTVFSWRFYCWCLLFLSVNRAADLGIDLGLETDALYLSWKVWVY